VIECRTVAEIDCTARRAGFRIIGAEDQSVDPCLHDDADAHSAGLQRDIQSCAVNAVILNGKTRCAQRDDLGVGAGVGIPNGAILSARKDFIAYDDDCTDRNFACRTSLFGLVQRLLHEAGVYSHSIVAGGLPEMSYVTLEMPSTSLMMRKLTCSRNSYGSRAQRAVMKSIVSTARNAMTYS